MLAGGDLDFFITQKETLSVKIYEEGVSLQNV
jgi:hypothetical protein